MPFATSSTCAIRFLLVRPFSGVAPTYGARQPAGSVVQAARKDETKRKKPYHAKVDLCVLPLRDPPPLPEDQAPASRSAPATRNGSEATTGAAHNSMAPLPAVRLVGSPRSTMWTTVGKPVQSSSAGASGGM